MSWMRTIIAASDVLMLDDVFKYQKDVMIRLKQKFAAFAGSSQDDNEIIKRCSLLEDFAVACLKGFVMENWSGPCLEEEHIPDCIKDICTEEFDELVLTEFMHINGEGMHTLCRKLGLFFVAYTILIEMSKTMSLKVAKLWKLRCLIVYQSILEENSHSAHEELLVIAESELEDGCSLGMDIETRVQFHLECAHAYLKYYGYKKAKEHLDKAGDTLGIIVDLSGAPGKRTKFQEKELAQLRISVTFTKDRVPHTEKPVEDQRKNLPMDVLLNDDTLLPQVKYSTDEDIPYLRPLEQAYIISLCLYYQKSKPKDNLLVEELIPYVQVVLKDPQVWSVQAKALHIRSMLESQKRRTVERSMLQMEKLISDYRTGTPLDESKLCLLHSVDMFPRWMNEANFAHILVLLGCTKAALEIFERIESWDGVIECYQKLGRLEKAENVIRRELEKRETPKLWCLLGDVTGSIVYYEKAWKFSNYRNARSQRSLGFHYLRAGKLQECIPYFQASLEVSSLQPQVWFSLGCTSMATGQLELAQTAFQRFVMIEPDSYEAWTNLANVFIRTNQKRKAFKALKEALKSNHASWQVWENYLLVTVDIGEFKETIRCFHNLLDLNRKEIDVEVLQILVRAVIADTPDSNGVPASSLKSKLKELFGRICSQCTNNAEIWLLYGDLNMTEETREDQEKALNNYMKAHRSIVQNAAWEQNQSKLKIALEICNKLSNVTLDMITAENIEGRDVQMLSSTKMAVSNFLRRFDIVFPDGLTHDAGAELFEALETLKKKFEQISELLVE